jgi:hypothetical protein
MFTKFMITLVAMIAVIAALFSPEIKENYNFNTPVGQCFDGTCPPSNVLLGPWAGNGLQMARVGNTPISRGDCKFADNIYNPSYKLGYDTRSDGTMGANVYPRGIATLRNMQCKNPTRFNNNGSTPKFGEKSEEFMASAAVPYGRTEVNGTSGCGDNPVYSGFGQLQYGEPDSVENFSDYSTQMPDLPSDMCTVNNLGEGSQPVMYDRLIYSNIKSRLRGHGDYIRGDLMITPDNYKCDGGGHPGWFQVSAKPNRDLNMGAMSMIAPVGGRDEEIALGIAQGDCSVTSFGV